MPAKASGKARTQKPRKFQPLRGMRDLLPAEAARFQWAIDTIRSVFERYGFQPLFTPAMEPFELLAAKTGEGVRDEIYYFKDKSAREVGLRFELTASLARVVASNPNMPKPFKRYQIAPVWRYDNPQAKRWREFWQADIDIVGSYSVLADVEVLQAAAECMQALGFGDFKIRINNRALIEDFLLLKGVAHDAVNDAFRSIDKLEKMGEATVLAELSQKGIDGEALMPVLKLKGNSKILAAFDKERLSEQGKAALSDLRELLRIAKEVGIEKWMEVDLCLVRGLDYYTGLVYEIALPEVGVSVGGGGRYNRLVADVGGPELPATGISLGVDRIVDSLRTEPKLKPLVFIASASDSVRLQALKLAQSLRAAGCRCMTDVAGKNLTKQLAYADSVGAAYAIIVGEREIASGIVKIRDMAAKTETEKMLAEMELWAAELAKNR
ncbi:MAG: histidine--tRNA ligase [Candidatus Aenigmatarchaeota archaeon]